MKKLCIIILLLTYLCLLPIHLDICAKIPLIYNCPPILHLKMIYMTMYQWNIKGRIMQLKVNCSHVGHLYLFSCNSLSSYTIFF